MATALATTIAENECPYCHNQVSLDHISNHFYEHTKYLNDDEGTAIDGIFISSEHCLVEDQYEVGPLPVTKINYCPMCGRKLGEEYDN